MKGEPPVCFRCGRQWPVGKMCNFRNFKCQKCGTIGHSKIVSGLKREEIIALAKRNTIDKRGGDARNDRSEHKTVNKLQEIAFIEAVRSMKSDSRIIVPVKIEGNSIQMEFDSGDPYSVILHHTMNNLGVKCELSPPFARFLLYDEKT